MPRTKTMREIPFAQVEYDFHLAGYWLGSGWHPAVKSTERGYRIRVLKSETRSGISVSTTYDYFELDADGMVRVAPRGWAKDYKPGRITGLDEAVVKYTLPEVSA